MEPEQKEGLWVNAWGNFLGNVLWAVFSAALTGAAWALDRLLPPGGDRVSRVIALLLLVLWAAVSVIVPRLQAAIKAKKRELNTRTETDRLWTPDTSLKLHVARARLIPRKDGSATLDVTWIAANLSPFPVYVSSIEFNWFADMQGGLIMSCKRPKHYPGKGIKVLEHSTLIQTTEVDGSVEPNIKRLDSVVILFQSGESVAIVEGHWDGQKPVAFCDTEPVSAPVHWHAYPVVTP